MYLLFTLFTAFGNKMWAEVLAFFALYRTPLRIGVMMFVQSLWEFEVRWQNGDGRNLSGSEELK